MNPTLLYLPVFVAIEAYAQGLLTATTREWVPPTKQAKVNLPVHYLYPCLYVLFTVALAGNFWFFVFAGLVRLALFDVILNKVRGNGLYFVGTSAGTDKMLRKLSPNRPERLSMIVRLSALAAAVAMFFI